MKNSLKKLISLFLVLILIIGYLPISSFASREGKRSEKSASSKMDSNYFNRVTNTELVNGDFESPVLDENNSPKGYNFLREEEVDGWLVNTDDKIIELWWGDLLGVTSQSGRQHAELNARQVGALYQDIRTEPLLINGAKQQRIMTWSLYHRGRYKEDEMHLKIGQPKGAYTGELEDHKTYNMKSKNDSWTYYTGSYAVPLDQDITRFVFSSQEVNPTLTTGNLLDNIIFKKADMVMSKDSYLESSVNKSRLTDRVNKEGYSIKLGEDVYPGDVINYLIEVQNIGDENLRPSNFKDLIPKGTEFVKESLFLNDSQVQADFKEEVKLELADLKPNEKHTIKFQVKVLPTARANIKNIASLDYRLASDNSLISIKSNEVENPLKAKEAKMDLEKNVKKYRPDNSLVEIDDYVHKGDLLQYSLDISNKGEAGSNLDTITITDQLPPGIKINENDLISEDVSLQDNTIIWTVKDLKEGQTRSLKFDALVYLLDGEILNTAYAKAPGHSEKASSKVLVKPYDGNIKLSKKIAKDKVLVDTIDVSPGQYVDFRIDLSNSVEDSRLYKLLLEDSLDPGLEFVESLDSSPEPTIEGNKLKWEFESLDPKEDLVVSYRLKVLDSSYGSLKNTARVSARSTSGKISEDYDSALVNSLRENGILRVSKDSYKIQGNQDIPSKEFKVGDTVKYLISYENIGPENSLIKEISFTDSLPDSLEIVGLSPGLKRENNTISFETKNLEVGQPRSFFILAKIKEPGNIRNIVSYEGKGEDGSSTPDSGSSPESIIKVKPLVGRLDLSKSAKLYEGNSPVTINKKLRPGDRFQFNIRLNNLGEEGSKLEDILVFDELPDAFEVIPESVIGGSIQGQKVSYKIKELDYNSPIDLSFDVIIRDLDFSKKGLSVVNTPKAQLNKDLIIGQPVELLIYPNLGSLKISKHSYKVDGDQLINTNKTRIKVGDRIRYRIELSNTEKNTLIEDIDFEDKLPKGISYIEASLNIGDEYIKDATINYRLDELSHKKDFIIEFDALVNGDVVDDNIVNKSLAWLDGKSIEDSNSIFVIKRSGLLDISKNVSKLRDGQLLNTGNLQVKPGDRLRYSLKVSNIGEKDSLINKVYVYDLLPEGLDLVEDSLPANAILDENKHISYYLGDLVSGESKYLDFDVIVNSDVIGEVRNYSEAIGLDQDSKELKDSAINIVDVSYLEGSLKTSKEVLKLVGSKETPVNVTEVNPGDLVQYYITVTNNADKGSILEDINVIDNLPEGLDLVEGSISDSGYLDKGLIYFPTIKSLKSKESKSFSFKARVNDKIYGNIVNTAISKTKDQIDLASSSILVSPIYGHLQGYILASGPDDETNLSTPIVKTGDQVKFTIGFSIYDYSEDLHGYMEKLILTDSVPDGFDYIDDSIKLEIFDKSKNIKENQDFKFEIDNKKDIKYEFPRLEEGSLVEVSYLARVNGDIVNRDIINMAHIEGLSNQNFEEVNPSVLLRLIASSGELTGSKDVRKLQSKKQTLVRPGDLLEYDIEIKNSGPKGSIIKNVVLRDPIPRGLSIVAESLPEEARLEDNTIIVDIGDLKGQDSYKLTYRAIPNGDLLGRLINIAYVEGIGSDNESIKEEFAKDILVHGRDLNVEVYKKANKDSAGPNEEVEYSLVLINKENFSLENIRVTDVLPEAMEVIEDSLAEGSIIEDGLIKFPPRKKLEGNKSLEFKFKARLKDNIPPELENKANFKLTALDRDFNFKASHILQTESQPKDKHYAYIVGYPDKEFKPENNISRAEVSAIISRVILKDMIVDQDYTNDFSDVPKSSWYSDYISHIYSQNIILGYPDGKFRPDRSITRGEFVTMLVRTKELSEAKSSLDFSDIEGHWAEDYIYKAASKGWIEGYPDGSFKPDKFISREETVTIVNKILKMEADTAYIDKNIKKLNSYPDLNKDRWSYYDIIEASNTHIYKRESHREKWLENLIK